MKSKLVSLLIALTLSGTLGVRAQGTTFSYHGWLTDGGSAYTGTAEFQPTLWNAESGGGLVAANTPATVIVGVTNGLFILPLDYGANFPGAPRWAAQRQRP